jgi:four helix bundle protein
MLKDNLIAELSKQFALRIIKLYKYLLTDKKEYVMAKQVYRSGTSIGANIAESKNAQSKADFISKLSIALKEASETEYWLELLCDSETISEKEFKSLSQDLNVIIGTLIKIIKKTKENMEVIEKTE